MLQDSDKNSKEEGQPPFDSRVEGEFPPFESQHSFIDSQDSVKDTLMEFEERNLPTDN